MMDQAVVSGLLDAIRTTVAQFDVMIDLLKRIEAQQIRLVDFQDATMELLAMMLGASLDSAPRTTVPVTVPTTQIVLAENESEPLMLVEISNHDPAQALQVGSQGVTILAGHEVAPLSTVPFVLPLGNTLYGICTAATIAVSVAMRYPPIDLVKAVKDATQWKQLTRSY